jgi:hypothetical protein
MIKIRYYVLPRKIVHIEPDDKHGNSKKIEKENSLRSIKAVLIIVIEESYNAFFIIMHLLCILQLPLLLSTHSG